MTASADDGYDFFASGASAGAALPTPSVPPASVAAPKPPSRGGMLPAAALTPDGPLKKPSRWAKSDTTFGPAGRLIVTIAMIVPLLFFIATGVLTFDPFVFIGAGIWVGLMFVGLRQVWQPVHHHHRR